MYAGQQFAGVPGISTATSDFVIATVLAQTRITQPAVCMNRAARFDAVFNKAMQTLCRRIRNRPFSVPMRWIECSKIGRPLLDGLP